MLSFSRNGTPFSGFIWFGIIILLAIIIVNMILPRMEMLVGRAAYSVGGELNVIMFLVVLMAAIFVAPVYLQRLQPVPLIALSMALLPIIYRTSIIFTIPGFTAWDEGPRPIKGISLLAPLLFLYLSKRFPVKDKKRVMKLPSSKAFLILAASVIITQFLFFSPFLAVRIAYLMIGVQLIWYLIIVRYVNTMQDAYKIIWGITIALAVASFFTFFTYGYEQIYNPAKLFTTLASGYQSLGYGRIASSVFGSVNEFPMALTSTLCLLPVLYYRAHSGGKILIVFIAIVLVRDLFLTGTRGGILALLPIMGYFLVLHRRGKYIVSFIGIIVIGTWLFWDQIAFFLAYRTDIGSLSSSFADRLMRWSSAWNKLITFPTFFTGLGMATLGNVSVHYPHQGFLYVWVNSGLFGLIGFSYWLFYSMWAGIKKFRRSYSFEEKLLLMGLVASVFCWIIIFFITKGFYTGGRQILYIILTTQVGLLVALGQKNSKK